MQDVSTVWYGVSTAFFLSKTKNERRENDEKTCNDVSGSDGSSYAGSR